MTRFSAMLGILCALVLVGLVPPAPAWADTYTDANDGPWTTQATWDVGVGYPNSGDIAVINTYMVTVNILLTGNDAPDEIFLGGGILDGPTTISSPTVDSPITVEADSEIRASEYRSFILNGAISDGTSTTGVLTVNRNQVNWQSQKLQLYGASPGFSGGWLIQSGGIQPQADGALGTGTVTIDGGVLDIRSNQTGVIAPALVKVNTDGGVSIGTVTDWDFELAGGYVNGSHSATISGGTIKVTADSRLVGQSGSGDHHLAIGASLVSGPGVTLTLDYQVNQPGMHVDFSGDNSAYQGDIVVPAPFSFNKHMTLHAQHDNSLGSGTVVVRGTLAQETANLNFGKLILDGGTLSESNQNYSIPDTATIELSSNGGGISIDGQGRTYTIDAKVTGPGALTARGVGYVAGPGTYTDRIKLTNAASDYSGGTSLDFYYGRGPKCRGELVVTANGALGGGTLLVNQSRVVTEPDDVNDAVLTSVPIVEVRGGTLELKSTENHGKIHLCEGGALINTDGSTTISYGVSGNIHVHDGAIIHPDLPLPDAGDIESACKNGQIYLGLPDAASGTYTVGGVVKGVATVDNWPTLSGTVNDTDGNGISLYVQDLRYMTLNGASLVTAGPINLEGGGRTSAWSPDYTGFALTGDAFAGMTGSKVMNMNADGRLYVNSTNGVPSGATLNVNNGVVFLGQVDTLENSSQVVLNYGGGLYLDKDITTGAVTANSGSGVYVNGPNRLSSGASFTWNGGGLVMPFKTWASGVPANANYLLAYELYNVGVEVTGDFVLTDDTRITNAASYRESGRNYVAIEAVSGDVTTTGNSARLAVEPDLAQLRLRNKVNIPGKTLIIGDANTFRAMRWDGMGFEDILQNGRVKLENNDSVIGDVWIQAGELYYDSPGGTTFMGVIGNAREVRVDGGANLGFWHGYQDQYAIKTTLSGNGTASATNQVYIHGARDGGGAHVGTLSPGASVGVIHIDSSLGFRKTNYGVDDDEYAHLLIDVAGSGGVGGTDHDQVAVTGIIGTGEAGSYLSNADLKVALPLPSGVLNPNILNGAPKAGVDMDIIVGGSLAGGNQFHAVALSDDTDSHWAIDDATAVTYDTGNAKVILHGSAITWTGFGGDSDLNGLVNYLDLGVLATNYDLTGLGWGDGDFNFDGKVDYMDLGILATNYDLTEGSGGANIPEPAFVVLLGAGVVGLLRRRRR